MSFSRVLGKLDVYKESNPLDASYGNDGLPDTVTTLGNSIDYLVSSIFPNARPSVPTENDLPTGTDTPNPGDVTPSLNDYRIVDNYNGTGQAAGYRYTKQEGQASPQWNLVQMFDSLDSILQQWELNAAGIFVQQDGIEDVAGQTIHGSTLANGDLTLSANSGDGTSDPALQTGHIKLFGDTKPSADNIFDLGTAGERFASIYLSGDLSDGTNALSVLEALTAYNHSLIVTGNPHAVSYDQLTTTIGNVTIDGDVGTLIVDFSSSGDKTFTLAITDDSHNHTVSTITDFTDERYNEMKASLVDTAEVTWTFNDPLKQASAEVTVDTGSLTDVASPAVNKVLVSNAAGDEWITGNGDVELTNDLSGSGVYNSATDKVSVAATVENVAINNVDRINIQNLTTSISTDNPAQVTQASHGLVSGRKVNLFGHASLDGEYTVTLIDANTYSIPVDNSVGAIETGYAIPDGSQFMYDSALDEWNIKLEYSQISHYELSGLTADDHTQYNLINGRSDGTTNKVTGGESASGNLYLRSTSDATKGDIRLEDNVTPETGASYSGGWSGTDIGATGRRFRDIYLAGIVNNLRVEAVGSLPAASIQDKGRILLLNGGDLYITKDGVTYKKLIDEDSGNLTDWEQETPAGLVNGANVTYTLTSTPKSNKAVQLYLNGLIQRQVTDYTVAGTTITMVTAPAIGQDIYAVYDKG